MPDEVLSFLRRTSRRILARRVIETAGIGAIVAGLVATGCQITLWTIGQPHRVAGLMILLAGLLIGAAVAIVKGVSLRQAARYMDNLAELDERLTTAVELADARDRSSAAYCVYAQAAEATGSSRVAEVSLWVRGRVTLGAAMLAVFLCGATSMLPQSRRVDEQIIASLGDMSPEAIRALADEFARAAQAADTDAPLLARAAHAARQKDARALSAILDDLRRRGVKLVRIMRPDVLALAMAGGSDAAGSARTKPAVSDPIHSGGHAGGPVHVWDPLYDKFASNKPAGAKPKVNQNSGPTVTYSDAWSAAHSRAAGVLRTGSLRPEYRAMVREFFSDRK